MAHARRITCLAMGGILGFVFCPFVLVLVVGLFGVNRFSDLKKAIGNIAGAVGGGASGSFMSADSLAARWSLCGALAIGFVSFLSGFVGPLVFTLEANQGPLLGIFCTETFGFIVGAIVGMVIGFAKESRRGEKLNGGAR